MARNGIYRLKNPSNKDRIKYIKALEDRINFLEHTIKHIVKDQGSNLTPGRYNLIVMQDLGTMAVQPDDVLTIEPKEGTVWFVVEEAKKSKPEEPLIVVPGILDANGNPVT